MPRLDRQDALAEPAVVGLAQRHLHLGLRMQAEEQHRGREQAGIVDPHRVHPALGHVDVAVGVGRRLLQPAQVRARDAAAGVLIADLGVHHRGAAAALDVQERLAPDHRIVDVLEDLLVGFVLVVVRIDVDDQEVLIVALAAPARSHARARRWSNSGRSSGVRISLRMVSIGFSLQGRSGDHEDVVTAPDDVELPQLQATVADAFAGLEVVFVAVPGAGEMHLVGEGLALIGSVRADQVHHLVDQRCPRRPARRNGRSNCCRRNRRRPCRTRRSPSCRRPRSAGRRPAGRTPWRQSTRPFARFLPVGSPDVYQPSGTESMAVRIATLAPPVP